MVVDGLIWSRTVAKVSAAGSVIWSSDESYPAAMAARNDSVAGAKWIGLDADENVFLGGSFQGTLTAGPVTLASAGDFDAYVRVLDPSSGHTKAIGSFGGTGTDTLMALTVDASGNAVLVGVTGTSWGTSSTTQLFVAKLGF